MVVFFAGVCGCELDGTRGSKGEPIRWLLERGGTAPERSLMIGDPAHDVLGAAQNGVPAAAVLWGYGSEDELRAAGSRSQGRATSRSKRCAEVFAYERHHDDQFH